MTSSAPAALIALSLADDVVTAITRALTLFATWI
jgi:hypothetical protein